MDNIKILCLGAEHYINQIDRIRAGLSELGVEITNNDYNYIYCNDPTVYEKALTLKKDAKLIFNILDIAPHLIDKKYDISRYPCLEYGQKRNFNIENFKEQLSQADIITCICKDVQRQIKKWCELNAAVIYNPIKDVSFLNLSESQKIIKGKKYKHLFIGRACDPNKRFFLLYQTMNLLGDSSDKLAVVGTENPGWGDYLGILDDNSLNHILNSVEYLWLPSAFKSIGLPALEAVVTKTIPIVCNDDPAGDEFFEGIQVPPNPTKIAELINNKEWNTEAKHFVEKRSQIFYNRFNKYQIARNILQLI